MTTLSPAMAHLRDRLFNLLMRQFDHLEAMLDPPKTPLRTALLRRASDIVALWNACEHRACRRARQCRRQHGDCVMRFAPLLTPEARAYVAAKLKAQYALRSFPRKRESR